MGAEKGFFILFKKGDENMQYNMKYIMEYILERCFYERRLFIRWGGSLCNRVNHCMANDYLTSFSRSLPLL